MIAVRKFVFNPFQENTFIVHDETHAIVFDPGCYDDHERDEISEFIETRGLKLEAILQTHAHVDHVLGVHFLRKKYSAPFYLHQEDLSTLNAVASYAHVYGFESYTPPGDPDILLQGGEMLCFGSMSFRVLFTPGHSLGHVVYFFEDDGFVINGDVLFAGSFGRTDLPGGNFTTLKHTIHEVMFKLPDETLVYCGHGAETTIGSEKRSNYINQF